MQSSVKLQTLWSNDYGRYLVAACDIPEKTEILLEGVLLHAPADDAKNGIAGTPVQLCLVCCRRTDRLCSSCKWHICSGNCEKMQCHANECKVFARNKVKFPPPHSSRILNKTILVLRCLLTKICDRRVWAKFLGKLEHHSKVRSTKPACNRSDNMIVDNIQYIYSLEECPFADEEIRTVCGIINVNAFFAEKVAEDASCRKAKCLFEKASLFAHSCSPNCSWTIDFTENETETSNKRPDITIKIVTANSIKQGEMLTIFYSTRYALYGTLKRIVLMEEIAHFQCKCTRCCDRTELNTFMSAVKCSDCQRDYLLPQQPTEVQSDWKCGNSFCERTWNVTNIVCRVYEIEDCVEKIRALNLNVVDELKLLSAAVEKYAGKVVHRNHYSLQDIAMRMVQLVVDDGTLSVEDVSEINLPNVELFIEQCEYLLGIAYTLLPAMTGYVGTLESYLQEAELIRSMIKGNHHS